MASNTGSKIKTLLWKAYTLRMYHYILTIFDIFFPIIAFILFGVALTNFPWYFAKDVISEPVYVESQSSKEIYESFDSESQIWYVPRNKFTTKIMEKVKSKLKLPDQNILSFHTETALFEYYKTHNTTIFAVIFKNTDNYRGTESPIDLNYVIMPSESYGDWDMKATFDRNPEYVPNSGSAKYFKTHFIALQMILDTSYIEMVSAKQLPVALSLQEFPQPPQSDTIDRSILYVWIPVATIFGFIPICFGTIPRVLEEKNTGIKELMKMMGLTSWMLWLGWFLYTFVINFISVLFILLIVKARLWSHNAIIQYCDGALLLVFLLMYCAASITFCFAISAFFYKPTIALLMGILAWIFSYSIYALVPNTMIWSTKLLFGILPNIAIQYGFRTISVYEKRDVRLNWANMYESADGSENDVTMGYVLLILLVDVIIFSLITFYTDSIFPGPYGVLNHSNLFKLNRSKQETSNRVTNEEQKAKLNQKIEPVDNLEPGIEIKNIIKKFNNVTAVNDLSFDVYKQEITVLLGYNGAGKTTTMSIITGMLVATNGNVFINGLDITTNIDEVRSSMGLCPQHNLHFTDLTVIQHLKFFGMLKGLSIVKAENEGIKLLKKMNLYEKRNQLASTLSGGMKRKLSLAIALIGEPKIIILDEPTTGLDPEARREIWDILLSIRGNRAILITTHSMEEADVLGDRIAIMDHGNLICYGTSMFLKNKYGTGYHLSLTRNRKDISADDYQTTTDITAMVQHLINGAVLQSRNPDLLVYLLPHDKKSSFHRLLKELETNGDQLGITNINMSVTTLEEVFLRVEHLASEQDKQDQNANEPKENSTFTMNTTTKLTGCKLLRLQVWSLFKKRWYFCRKKWRLNVAILIIILLLVFIGFETSDTSVDSITQSNPEFEFNLRNYGKTTVFYGYSVADTLVRKMRRRYHKLAKSEHAKARRVRSVSKAILKEGRKNIVYYLKYMIVAAEFNFSKNTGVINAMYSNRAYHGAPISVNLVMNAILKATASKKLSIRAANSPFSVFTTIRRAEGDLGNFWKMYIPLCLSFIVTTFLYYPHAERVSNVKQLQLMCGVRSGTYWLICFTFDFILYTIYIIILVLFIAIYGNIRSTFYTGVKQQVALFIIFLIFGLAGIPFAYLFSYKSTITSAVSWYILASMCLSLLLIIFDIILLVLKTFKAMTAPNSFDSAIKIIKYIALVLCIIPPCGITEAISLFLRKTQLNDQWEQHTAREKKSICEFLFNPCCEDEDSDACEKYKSYYNESDGITYAIIIMAFSTILYFVILLLIDTHFVCKLWEKTFRRPPKVDTDKQSDGVKDEMRRISEVLKIEKQGPMQTSDINEDELLLVHKVQKNFGKQAVLKGISFGVKPGDCFGLLGVNGAGKTTTFRILTGDLPLINGEARIITSTNKKVYLSTQRKKYLQNVGYCPQFDAINEHLTGRQMLTCFAELRGVSERINDEVDKCIRALGLEEYAEEECGRYSGGNKRKLCVAMALVAGPPLVMLDEPTSGVDPASRRKFWDIVTAFQSQTVKPTIIITSHSMDECEALCNRLAIMKAGQLECCGTIPDLKLKYGQGFTVTFKLKQQLSVVVDKPSQQNTSASASKPSATSRPSERSIVNREDLSELQRLVSSFERRYQGLCELKDKRPGWLQYYINDPTKKWGRMFTEMEYYKTKHPIIEDYYISETTLEKVFLSIAKADLRDN